MKKISTTLILVLFSGFLFGQNPLAKTWDKRFGSTVDDLFTCIFYTKDGGYILGGYSGLGISGDKTQPSWGGNDYWIIKIDSLGNKQWDKDFGGTGNDDMYYVQQTTDNGYILGGHSNSGISGDKTQASQGGADYWIVKTDSLGNKQWDKTFGGSNHEYLFSIKQTNDGGYLSGGISLSDSSGDKTQDCWDTSAVFNYQGDYWIVKTDSLGNKQWDKDFGGENLDRLYSLQQTLDGGFILGGFSASGISGDKTQPVYGLYDYWIIKTDSLGNKQWDKDYGGTDYEWLLSLQQTTDAGYILGGVSQSGIGGDKTQPTWGGTDYWIIKTDSLGNKQWDKDFGGTGNEQRLGNIIQTGDNGFLLAGTSYSPISGDKSENNLGIEQGWIVKTDSSGIKQWDKTIFTTGYFDDYTSAIQTNDSCFIIALRTSSGIGGYKTQPNWDTTLSTRDYWIINFCDTTFVSSISGSLIVNSQLSIYPNPFTNELTVKWDKEISGDKELILFDVTGKEILRHKTSATETKLNTEKLSAGFYLLNYKNANYKLLKY